MHEDRVGRVALAEERRAAGDVAMRDVRGEAWGQAVEAEQVHAPHSSVSAWRG